MSTWIRSGGSPPSAWRISRTSRARSRAGWSVGLLKTASTRSGPLSGGSPGLLGSGK